MNTRAKHGTIKPLAEKLEINPDHLSMIFNGTRGISKKRAIKFENICKEIGYNFTAQDWIFEPNKIKQQLRELK